MIQTVGLLLPMNQLERLLSQLHEAGEVGRGVEHELLSSLSLHLHQLRPRHAPALFSLRWAAARLVAGRLGNILSHFMVLPTVLCQEMQRRWTRSSCRSAWWSWSGGRWLAATGGTAPGVGSTRMRCAMSMRESLYKETGNEELKKCSHRESVKSQQNYNYSYTTFKSSSIN